MAPRGQSSLACEELLEPVENVWNAEFPAVLNDFRALNVEIFLAFPWKSSRILVGIPTIDHVPRGTSFLGNCAARAFLNVPRGTFVSGRSQ